MRYLIDTSQIIEWLRNGTLKLNFDEMNENGDEIWIAPDVQREVTGQLDDDERIKFETLYKEGIEAGYIIHSRHNYRVKEPFKTLAQDLRMEKVRLERTDRNLIALSLQIKAKIRSIDSGITEALDILRHANNPWKKYILAVEREDIEDPPKHQYKENS